MPAAAFVIKPNHVHGPQPRAASILDQGPIQLEARIDDDKVKSIFAWISRAIDGDELYDDIALAIAAVFGDLPKDSEPVRMVAEALDALPLDGNQPVGAAYSAEDREVASLGPLGAGQWSGQSEEIFPHSLLVVSNLTGIDQWQNGLPRTVRQNFRRAQKIVGKGGNFSVTARPIHGGTPAPQSSLNHFRCIVEHQLRIQTRNTATEGWADAFFGALCEAVERFVCSTRMAGTIHEYRRNVGPNDATGTGPVMAFLHEVHKGRTMRGQWFYATDEAASAYVWFHSVRDLVQRALENGADVVDLGPNGSDGNNDAHAELKQKCGFSLVEDWPTIADYRGELRQTFN